MYFSKLLFVTFCHIDGKFEHLKSQNKLGNYNE